MSTCYAFSTSAVAMPGSTLRCTMLNATMSMLCYVGIQGLNLAVVFALALFNFSPGLFPTISARSLPVRSKRSGRIQGPKKVTTTISMP